MEKKTLLLIILLLTLIYPIFSLIQLDQAFRNEPVLETVQDELNKYRLSIWISWIVFAVASVYYKWTRKENFFFKITYIFLLVTFIFFGYYTQQLVNTFEITTPFKDKYSLGVFTAIQNLLAPAVLTIFLQLAVWWFTRRFHR